MQVDHEYILVIVDEYSKFVIATVCFPKILRSDNCLAFIAKPVTDYLKIVGVEQQFSSPHNHKSNAFVERFNRVLRAAIRINRNINLMETVSHFTYAYNRSKHMSTGLSLAQIMLNTAYHFIDKTPIHNGYSGIHNLIKDTKQQFDEPYLQRHGFKLKIGNLVLRKLMHRKDATTSHKKQPTLEGPFEIIKHLYGDTYEIERVSKHRKTRLSIEKVHADRHKRYIQ
uniref:Integrase catalytic domain-containing protein n=1 Tax=Strongyloides stercoralis TaxID=6248 RepID=A0A0K0EMN9_STRER